MNEYPEHRASHKKKRGGVLKAPTFPERYYRTKILFCIEADDAFD
jgi:hypothetical protein